MNRTLRSGLIGVAILVSLNAIGYFVLAQPAAVAFSEHWWSTWFPVYAVCVVLLSTGPSRRCDGGLNARDLLRACKPKFTPRRSRPHLRRSLRYSPRCRCSSIRRQLRCEVTEVHPRFWVGGIEDCGAASSDFAIVHACKAPCHQHAVGYRGSLSSDHPKYLAH